MNLISRLTWIVAFLAFGVLTPAGQADGPEDFYNYDTYVSDRWRPDGLAVRYAGQYDIDRAHEPRKANPYEGETFTLESFETVGSYAGYMAYKLDCYFTFEDRLFPYDSGTIERRKRTGLDPAIETLDALVAHLNERLDDAKAFRSTVRPNVIHLVADAIRTDDYLLDKKVTLAKHEGPLSLLPAAIGQQFEGRLSEPQSWPIGPYWHLFDYQTKIAVEANDEVVRDVLTKAVPLDRYYRTIWRTESRSNRQPESVWVYYAGRVPTVEEEILSIGLDGYLVEMGRRLDCYFTIEDDWTVGKKAPSVLDFLVFWTPDFSIQTIDTLIADLDHDLNLAFTGKDLIDRYGPSRVENVRVVRNPTDPRVIHLIRSTLPYEGDYLMTKPIEVPQESAYLREGCDLWDAKYVLDKAYGDKLSFSSNANVEDGQGESLTIRVPEGRPFRDILTLDVPRLPHRRIHWSSARSTLDDGEKLDVVFE